MPQARRQSGPRRNRSYDETHCDMIATAVRLISEKGADGLSIAALSREMGINRTTVYYHFDSREALLHAVTSWASEQLAAGMDAGAPQPERIGGISRFVLDNPELIKLWIEGFVSGGNIRDSYSRWDELVAGIDRRLSEEFPGEEIDAEVYCVMQLAGSIIGPHVFANSVRPRASQQSIAERFLKEQQRVLRRDRLVRTPELVPED
jgi:AcrR family transcriptional regulator